MAATFGRSDDAGGDAPRFQSGSPLPDRVGDRLHGDDEEGALQAIFIVMTELSGELDGIIDGANDRLARV